MRRRRERCAASETRPIAHRQLSKDAKLDVDISRDDVEGERRDRQRALLVLFIAAREHGTVGRRAAVAGEAARRAARHSLAALRHFRRDRAVVAVVVGIATLLQPPRRRQRRHRAAGARAPHTERVHSRIEEPSFELEGASRRRRHFPVGSFEDGGGGTRSLVRTDD